MNQEQILKRLEIIAELQAELNSMKTQYDEMLEDDPQYQEIQEKTQKFKEENKDKQEKVIAKPTYKAISDQVKEKRQEIKEQREALSQELLEFYKEYGTLEIEDPNGNIKRVKFSATLTN